MQNSYPSLAPLFVLNAVVYATWHLLSSSHCFPGAPMPLSHLAVGLWDFVATKMQCRIAAFVTGKWQRLLSRPEMFSFHRAVFDLRPGELLVYNCIHNLLFTNYECLHCLHCQPSKTMFSIVFSLSSTSH